MKIITRGVIDWDTLEILEEDCFEYVGPLSLCKDSGSPPQAVDPYTQAAAQYGLSTGTASYNAGLDRTNQVNPLGGSYWTTSNSGAPTYVAPSGAAPSAGTTSAPASTAPAYSPNPLSAAGLTGGAAPYIGSFGGGGLSIPGAYGGFSSLATPPTYTETTQLAPQFQNELQKPIDTTGIAGMPGGPSTTADLQNTQDALYKSQMQYLQPEQDLAKEQLSSQLANEGATVGSAAYNNEKDRLAREQDAATSNARTQAITGAGAEQSRLFGLGSQSLQNQIAVRNAPISEYNSLTGAPGANATALTPDISGAFGQQYQGQLAGYNATTASNNSTTSAVGSLALAAAMYF